MRQVAKRTAPKRRRPAPATALAFRPDKETNDALHAILTLRPGLDTSSLLREAVRAYARELTLDRYVAAARKRGNRGVAIVEEFERAGDA
jgi:hypothetical protein